MLVDAFGREVNYIRVSVTKACNFRCQYCMPNTPEEIDPNLVPLPNMLEFLKIAMDYGVVKIRLTGGEPLLRSGLVDFVRGIYSYKEGMEVVLTTNGFYLKKLAQQFKDAGLRRINISLDSLKPERVIEISKVDGLKRILEGIREAKRVGLGIKINMVPIKGVNDDEVLSLLNFCIDEGYFLRYIEYMENSFASSSVKGLSGNEIIKIIKQEKEFKMLKKSTLGPAKLFEITADKRELAKEVNFNINGQGSFGIITPHEDSFCASCNRIRITSDGIICPCLYFNDAINARNAMLSGDRDAMRRALLLSITNKPERNFWSDAKTSGRAFYQTGG